MGYPQPDPDKYTLGGQSFWRLNTLLTSDGDMYQSSQGSGGFAIGPDSDIAKVNIAYFDDQVPGLMNQIAISPDRPFTGLMFARNKTDYLPAKRPGRFLIWPNDLYNTSWRITGDWNLNPYNRIDFETPVLDVVEYFSPIALNAGRNNKTYQYDTLPIVPQDPDNPGGGTNMIIIPYYGRKYANVTFHNTDDGALSDFAVLGLNFKPGAGVDAGTTHLIQDVAPVPAFGKVNIKVLSTLHGMFDALVIQLTPGNSTVGPTTPLPLRITVSDHQD